MEKLQISKASKSVMKKHASKSAMKKPAASLVKKKPIKDKDLTLLGISPAERMKLKPDGCSKCRWVKGCTKSCWKGRGYEV